MEKPNVTEKQPTVGAQEDIPEVNGSVNIEFPTIIYSDDFAKIWYKHNAKLGSRRNRLVYFIDNPMAFESVENNFMVKLLAKILETKAELHELHKLGVRWNIYRNFGRLMLEILGSNKNSLTLANIIIIHAGIIANNMTEDEFKTCMKKRRKSFLGKSDSRLLALDMMASLTKSLHWTRGEQSIASKTVDYNKFRNFANCFAEGSRVECFAFGNFTKLEVIENVRECVEKLRCRHVSTKTLSPIFIREIPHGETVVFRFDTAMITSSVVNYYQCIDHTFKQSAVNQLFHAFSKEPMFEHLMKNLKPKGSARLATNILDNYGYIMLLECLAEPTSAKNVSVLKLDREIERFRTSFHDLFVSFTPEQWNEMRKKAVKYFAQSDESAFDEWTRSVNEISTRQLIFDRRQRYMNIFETMTIEDLRKRMIDVTSSGAGVCKMSVQVVGDSGTWLYSEGTFVTSPFAKNRPPTKQPAFTDIEFYKRNLDPLPFMDSSTVDDIAETVGKDCTGR